MGYVGPVLIKELRRKYAHAKLIGYDMGYFAHCLTTNNTLPERRLDVQLFGDIRNIQPEVLEGVDAVVNLAAISNDPMGNKFEQVTMEVNHEYGISLAKMAREAGVKSFVFASSCSMYGAAEDKPKTEDSPLNPLTAYARSKVSTETSLKHLANHNFNITCLRFATACGKSDRLRLDLVLNDFVAAAIVDKKILILSDGTPWRPLINVYDMARAIDWAINRKADNGGNFLAVNAGSNEWNYQVKELAETVAGIIPGVEVSINKDAGPDKRSYKVNFDLFKKLAPDYQPVKDLKTTIVELKESLEQVNFQVKDFRNSYFIRLMVLNQLQQKEKINDRLQWKN